MIWGLTADQLAFAGLFALLALITALVVVIRMYGGPPPPIA